MRESVPLPPLGCNSNRRGGVETSCFFFVIPKFTKIDHAVLEFFPYVRRRKLAHHNGHRLVGRVVTLPLLGFITVHTRFYPEAIVHPPRIGPLEFPPNLLMPVPYKHEKDVLARATLHRLDFRWHSQVPTKRSILHC